ncbi:unnamed protein product, partial [Meganyctiphanes norvegica]
QVLLHLLWTMNEKESQQLREQEEVNSATDQGRIDTKKLSQEIHPPPSKESNNLPFIGKVNPTKQNYGISFVGNINPTEPEAPKEPGGLIRKCGYRYKGGIGPPPRPFKKARYAWEIKNYEHTLSNMNQNLGDYSAPLQEDSQDSQSSDINSEGSQEDGPDPLDGLPTAGIEGINSKCFMVPRARTRADMMAPIMPAPYPTTYGMMAAPPPPSTPPQHATVDGSIQEPQQMPPDPDARILRWHTRQLCRSIFDNTVNRMLENMGFSPVTERSQGIHPLLVLSLSDDEEREAEEAQQRALENQALSAAMHQKGLFLPPYHYDPLESATTTDYDSSDDDSDLGEEPTAEDLQHDGGVGHVHMSHMVSRPLPRVPHMPPMPAMAGMPLIPNPHLLSSMAQHHHHPGSLVHNTLHLNNIHTTATTNPSPPLPASPISNQLNDASCDDKKQEEENGNNLVNNKETIDSNENVLGEKETCLTEEEIEMNETKSGLNGNSNEMERETPFIVENEEPKTKTDNENNNDKFFVDQAIQMAIKQQGLGFQHA